MVSVKSQLISFIFTCQTQRSAEMCTAVPLNKWWHEKVAVCNFSWHSSPAGEKRSLVSLFYSFPSLPLNFRNVVQGSFCRPVYYTDQCNLGSLENRLREVNWEGWICCVHWIWHFEGGLPAFDFSLAKLGTSTSTHHSLLLAGIKLCKD